MAEAFVRSGEVTVRVFGDAFKGFTPEELLVLRCHVPEAALIDGPAADVSLEVRRAARPGFSQFEGDAVVSGDWDGAPPDLVHVLYGVTRRALLARGRYPAHAACVDTTAGRILLAGNSGSGKTSVVLELLRRGATLFSGNKTVVSFDVDGQLLAEAGSKPFTVRARDEGKVDGIQVVSCAKRWGRSVLELAPEYLADPSPRPVRAIVELRLNDHVQESRRMDPIGALHALYPYFLDAVNADVVVAEADEVFRGTPPDGAQRFLASGLRRALADVPAISVVGSAAFVADEILKL